MVDGGDEKEISFDYDEVEDYVTIYIENKYICSMNYEDNFKKIIDKIKEKW